MTRRTDATRTRFPVRPRAPFLARAAACLVATAFLAGGCARGPAPEPAGGTITLALRDSFPTFDPAFAWDPAQTPFLRLVHEGLVAFDDSGRVAPACADRWDVVDGGRTIRFELRDDLHDANGRSVGAEDFARGFARLFGTGALRSPGAPQFVALEGALAQGTKRAPPLGVEAPNARTLVVRLAWPDPGFLEKLAQPRWVMPVDTSGVPVTNGPFRLVREPGAYAFVRDAAWGTGLAAADDRRVRAGTLDTIRVLVGVPARRALLGLESGRIDLLWPPPPEYRARLLRDPRYAHVVGMPDPPLTWQLVLNAEIAPTARRDARRGIALAVNRALVPEALGAWVAPWRAFTSVGDAGGATAPGYDPDRARLALEQARFFTGVRVPVSVTRAGATAQALEAIAPGLARGAVQVEAVALPRTRWVHDLESKRGFTAAIVPWQAPTRDGLDELAALYLNRGLGAGWGGNVARYRPGPALDSLLLRGLREADPVARASLTDQVGTLLASDLPVIPLVRAGDALVHRRGLTGVGLHPRGGPDLARIRPGVDPRP